VLLFGRVDPGQESVVGGQVLVVVDGGLVRPAARGRLPAGSAGGRSGRAGEAGEAGAPGRLQPAATAQGGSSGASAML